MSDGTSTARRSLRQRWLPHPVLTLVLTGFLLLLLNDLTMAGLVLGLILGVLVPQFTTRFWPTPPRVRNWPAVVSYFFLVSWDIVVANIQVAYWILFWKNEELQTKYFTVPLDIRVPEGIATLAGTVTMTPGTLSADLSADNRALLVHGLHVPDEAAMIATIKSRYEARLLEIFG